MSLYCWPTQAHFRAKNNMLAWVLGMELRLSGGGLSPTHVNLLKKFGACKTSWEYYEKAIFGLISTVRIQTWPQFVQENSRSWVINLVCLLVRNCSRPSGGSDGLAISINSAGPVTRDSPAENLVSARRQNGRDSMFFSAHREDFCGIYVEIVRLSWFHSNHEKRPLDCSGNFFLFLRDLFTIFSIVSAADQNRRDLRDFSAFGNDPWPVTAELIEMAQYCFIPSGKYFILVSFRFPATWNVISFSYGRCFIECFIFVDPHFNYNFIP